MKGYNVVALLRLFLGLPVPFGQDVWAASESASTRNALGKIGIADGRQIVIGDDCDVVERTAAE